MRAFMARRYGSPDVLALVERAEPIPEKNQVVVAPRYVAVNPKDCIVRKGKFAFLTGKDFPLPLGHDIAGEVVAAGPGADLAVGEKVFGMINAFSGWAYAERVAIGADEVARVPEGVSLAQAAAAPLAAQTALQALRDHGRVAEGCRLLINGASGGVGTYAVQMGRLMGAEITATCSSRNAELVSSLGAHRVVDYQESPVLTLDGPFDVFFDVFGNTRFDAARPLLAKEAHYVHTIPSPRIAFDVLRTRFSSRRAHLVVVRSRRMDLAWIGERLAEGRMRSVIDRIYPFEETPEAHRYLETKRARGKVLLEMPLAP